MDRLALRRRVAASLCVSALAALTPAAAQASTWTPLSSATTSDITAVEYQGGDRFWYTTPTQIIRRTGGVSTVVKTVPAAGFSDIEFAAGSPLGIAVGDNGTVYRSTDGGGIWGQVPLPSSSASATTSNSCAVAPAVAAGGIDAVHVDGVGNWWLLGAGSQVFRSTDGGASFTAANVGAPCRLPKDIDDAFFVPGSAAGYFISKDFGAVFYTADGLAGAGSERTGDAGNGFQLRRRVAGDPANTSRQWAVSPADGNGSYFARTETGWNSAETWDVPSWVTRQRTATYDLDYAGGTVVAVGAAGNIMQSTDGRNFTITGTGGSTDTTDWLTVSAASGNDIAVGGRGGVLVTTTDGAALPTQPVVVTPTPTPTPTATATPKPTTPSLPKPTLPSSTKPPLTGGAAKIAGRYVTFRVKGRLGLPRGLARKAACKGTMSISVYKGKKRLKTRTVKVDSKCGYKTTVKVKRSKVGRKTKKLKLKVAFRGNQVLGKLSSTYNVKVKK